jgi:hypothetical protein
MRIVVHNVSSFFQSQNVVNLECILLLAAVNATDCCYLLIITVFFGKNLLSKCRLLPYF